MRKILVLAFALVLVAAACGDDNDSTTATDGGGDTGTSEATEAAAPVELPGTTNNKGTGDATSGSLEVEADDFYFGPTFIKATPGQTVKISLHNEGAAPHTFTSTALNVDQQLAAGESAEVEVTLPESGATEFHCSFHKNMGMQGAFFFKEGDAVNAGATTGGSSDGGVYN